MEQGQLSPQKQQIILESEMQRNFLYQSPTKYDADFYIRKVSRLQNDLNKIQDELSNARIRLRKAEDFQLKYGVVVKQNNNLTFQNNKLTKEIQKLRVQIQKYRYVQQEQAGKKVDYSRQMKQLQTQLNHWKKKFQQVQHQKIQNIFQSKQKTYNENSKIIQNLRRQFNDKEQKYESEIRQLKKLLSQKETVDRFVGAKVDRVKVEKDKEINRLNQIIQKKDQEFQEGMSEKNEQLLKLKSKYESMLEIEINNIKNNLDTQNEVFNIEINGLKGMIEIKNAQIDKLMGHIKQLTANHERERQELLAQIKLLSQNIYKIQRDNELDLYNIKQRLTTIHSVQIKGLEAEYVNHINILKQDKADLQKLLKAKQHQLAQQLEQIERIKAGLHQKLEQKNTHINQTQNKNKEFGDINIKQSKFLRETIQKMEAQKQSMITQYQQNVSFLDQQIKRLTTNLEIKNIEIKNLQEDLAYLKKQYSQTQKQLDLKWKNQRKQREIQRQKFRNQKEDLQQSWKIKQRQWKMKQRAYQKQKQKNELQISRINFVLSELQKDNNRLNLHIKDLDQSLKTQIKQNQLSTLDTGGVKRELTDVISKQQIELQTLKRSEIEQIKKKYEMKIEKLQNHIERLQTDLVQKNMSLQTLQQEYKKLDNTNKNLQKINKQKMIQYQKKMATLNSEIYMTKNLYESFLESKNKLKKQNP